MRLDSVRVLSVARYVYDEEAYVSSHSHNFYHIVVVTGGRGSLTAGGNSREAARGEVYFIPPGTLHEIVSDSGLPLQTLEWKFHIDDAPFEARLSRIPLLFHERGTGLRPGLVRMIEEAIAQKPLYKEMITVRSIELLLELSRLHDGVARQPAFRPPDGGLGGPDESMSAVAAYIAAHCTDELTLPKLAARFHMSATRLSDTFRRSFGVPPIRYANELKLQRVKELLTATDMSVTAIAERAGFGSVHYMSRFFSRREKLSPLEYRQRAKRPRHIPIEDRCRIVDHLMEPADRPAP